MDKKLYLFLLFVLIGINGCSREGGKTAQGYIEGRYTYITTSVSGKLKNIPIVRGSQVKKGQLLLQLDDQPEIHDYNAAVENLQQAIAARNVTAANLDYAKLTYERNKILVPKKAIQQSQLDNSKSLYNALVAQLAEANAKISSTDAALARSKWALNQKTIYSPVDAIVFDIYYRYMERTLANQPIISLLAPSDIKVIFYVPERQLALLKLGEKVSFTCDSCQKNYTATISFISPTAEYTPPVIYSNQTNQKLIFRIEANLAPEDAYRLHPGEPVLVSYKPHG